MQDKVPVAKGHREYIEQVDEMKDCAITRGDLQTSRLSWQDSAYNETEFEFAEVSRGHSTEKKIGKA